MRLKFKLVVIAMGFAAVLGGCVSTGTYQQKEKESQMLSKNLDEARSAFSEMQLKYEKLDGEKVTLEAELKKQKDAIATSSTKNEKLADANSELAEKTRKLTLEIADSKAENDKLLRSNIDLTDNLKKLSGNFADSTSENSKLTLDNFSLTEKIRRLSVELEELKLANETFSTALKPENLLKTVSENFDKLQLKVDGLTGENVKLKETLIEMRNVTSKLQPPPETMSGGAGAESKPPAITLPDKDEPPLPEPVRKEKTRALPAAVEKN